MGREVEGEYIFVVLNLAEIAGRMSLGGKKYG